MENGYLGEVKLFAGNFAPRNWAFCHGELLQIFDYEALFGVLGTTYGGDGRGTFALPDLRGRTVVGLGKESNLSEKKDGESGNNTKSCLSMNYIICVEGRFPSRS